MYLDYLWNEVFHGWVVLAQEPQGWEHRAGESGSCKKAECHRELEVPLHCFSFARFSLQQLHCLFLSRSYEWISQAELSF